MPSEINHPPRFFIQTFGCQMNVNDSEKVAGLLLADGYERTDEVDQADVVFVNTCAVRERAAEKLYHAVGRLKRLKARKPGLLVGVGGCVAQLHGAAVLDRARSVDVLVGTHNIAKVPALFRRAREGSGRPFVDLDRSADSFLVPPSAVAHSSPVRAYVTVMEGCNHVCSFCVVPRTRGPEVCRSPRAILAEVQSLVAQGCPEVMLLGQTVNAYQYGEVDFAELLRLADAVPGLERLRFTTSHPDHVTARLADALRDLPRACPYLHLPVQSGSDRILQAMRRGYTRRGYMEMIALLRGRVPDLALSTDVIAGYPGETEEDFASTVDLVDEVGYEGLFVFAYSPRPGTTAFRRQDDLPEEEKRRRVEVLNTHQQRAQQRRNAAHVGRREQVLVDTVAEPGRVAGRTPHFRIVHLPGSADMLGRTVEVEITGAGPNSLTGKLPNRSLTEASPAPIL
jgi:tRNA-2-methylthio-N6-dimethylallyladenosine synthase